MTQLKILGLFCSWCAYAGAELCGLSRYRYPAVIRILRVPCSGWIPMDLLLRSIREGADGILIGGCHPGDCHYLTGNYSAEIRVELAKKFLELCGINSERLRLEWISAAEARKCSEVITDFSSRIQELGKLSVDQGILKKIDAAISASRSYRLSEILGRFIKLTRDGDVYGNRREREDLISILSQIAQTEFQRELILSYIKDKSLSIQEISEETKLPRSLIFEHLSQLRTQNRASIARIQDGIPYYAAV